MPRSSRDVCSLLGASCRCPYARPSKRNCCGRSRKSLWWPGADCTGDGLVVVANYLQELDQEVRAAPTGATSSAAAAAEETPRNAPTQQAARLVRGPGYLYTDAPKTATRNLVTPQYIITERSRKFIPTSLAPPHRLISIFQAPETCCSMERRDFCCSAFVWSNIYIYIRPPEP